MKFSIKKVKKLWHNEEGASIIIVALSLVVLFGFLALVADAGILFNKKRQLVTVADAAALAGAYKYGVEVLNDPNRADTESARNAAKTAATEYALKNGINDPDVEANNYKVTVDVQRNIDLFFAPVLGINTGTRKAHAVAKVGPPATIGGAIPIMPPTAPLGPGLVPLKSETPPPTNPGNFYALGLGGTGKENLEEKLKNGYNGTIYTYDADPTLDHQYSLLTTEPGNAPEKIENGIKYRIDRCNALHIPECHAGTVDDPGEYVSGCPRVVVVPVCVATGNIINGRDEVKVTGFMTFFIKSVIRDGSKVEIWGYEIKTVIGGGSVGTRPPGASDNVLTVNLVE